MWSQSAGLALAQVNGAGRRENDAEWETHLETQVETWLDQLGVADRVGQLFVVVFPGSDTSFESDIAELIHGYRIGGVLLTPRTGNFTNQSGVDTPRAVAGLVNRLQALSYGILLPSDEAIPAVMLRDDLPRMEEMTGVAPGNIPLFVAVEQAGDHLPATALRRGFTPLPSQMALGAAWNPELTRRVGAVVGYELSAVGANLVLGPDLNVVELPRGDEVGALGLHSFGGDPYWVAQQARAYIAGIHEGSGGRVVTIAGDFPGAGNIDRLPEQEIATVQRSLAHLRRMALPPFVAVTRRASTLLAAGGDWGATVGLMTSPTRYSAFQGGTSGRATPLNLTPELGMIVEQEGLGTWRERGLLVSPPLGMPSIRRYYSPTLDEFPYRRVAMDAFSAGHDLLLLDQFSLDGGWETQMRNIQATIGFFQERYVNDAAFAQQVDDSVRRILRLKLRLYAPETRPGVAGLGGGSAEGEVYRNGAGTPGELNGGAARPDPAAVIPLGHVLNGESQLDQLNNEHRLAALAVMGQVARESLTTLYPDPGVASEILSILPQPNDNIVIFTESRLLHECAACLAEPAVGPDELGEIMLRLYGPGATGQLEGSNVASLTFTDLAQVLARDELPADVEMVAPDAPLGDTGDADAQTDTPPLDKYARINLQLEQADWIIFAMLDVDEERFPYSNVVKRFLRERGDAMANKHIVVFALHAPYFLDATELSKLHAYYGVYSKTQPFIENAVRGFFRSYSTTGAPPVSVPGTRFAEILERTQPDPARVVDVRVVDEDGDVIAAPNPEEGVPVPTIEAGSAVRIQAGPLYDLNGKLVHDGTPLEFQLYYEGEEIPARQEVALTRGGVAGRELLIERGGMLRIVARTGEAAVGVPLLIGVQGGAEGEAGAVPPGDDEESIADETPPAAFVSAPVNAVPDLPAPQNGEGNVSLMPAQRLSLATFVVSLISMAAVLGLSLMVQFRILTRRMLVQAVLWAIICGFLAYVLYGIGYAPFGDWLEASLPVWGAVVVVVLAMLPPLVWWGWTGVSRRLHE